MSRLPIPHFIEKLFAEKADKPVVVTVTVDASGASMSAADLAKLTSDMVMCWYSGNRLILTSNLSILPGAGTATVTGTASSSTAFTIAFIHSATNTAIASVIPYETGKIQVTNVFPCFIFKDGNTCICQSTYSQLPANIPAGTYTQITTLPDGFAAQTNQFIPVPITSDGGVFKTYAILAVRENRLLIRPQTELGANTFNFFTFTYSTI